MQRAGAWWLLIVAGCYATPAKHQVSEAVREGDSGQHVDAAEGDAGVEDADVSRDGDAEPEHDAAGAEDGGLQEAGPACDCADPEQPICIEATGACVQCREESDCAADEHCMVATGQCVGCLDASHCADQASASFCDPATNTCSGCRDGMDVDCSNVPGLKVCQAGTCVQCAGARRDACGEATASCGASFSCEGCKADADCQRFGKVCDEATGACVACTVDSEAAQCGGKSCNPATHACTQTDRASVDVCSKCVADSECKADHRCIPMNFRGESRGGYCMKRSSSGCREPFLTVPIKRGSLSGAIIEDYCGIAESRASCEAVLALLANRDCPEGDASQCDAEGALCASVNSATTPRCTYACESSRECPLDSLCPIGGTDRYCGKL